MSNPPTQRHARLFRNGRNQALRIPREFELPGDEVIIHKEGDRLIVEPVKKPNTLAELLAAWEPCETLSLEPPVDEHYADIRNRLERAGRSIGPNDFLIAAHARALGLTLVTDNIREFSRVPSLAVENWLAPDA